MRQMQLLKSIEKRVRKMLKGERQGKSITDEQIRAREVGVINFVESLEVDNVNMPTSHAGTVKRGRHEQCYLEGCTVPIRHLISWHGRLSKPEKPAGNPGEGTLERAD